MLFLSLLKFTLLDLLIIFITAHRKASFTSGVYAIGNIRLFVRLSHFDIMPKREVAEGCSLTSVRGRPTAGDKLLRVIHDPSDSLSS